MFCGICRERKGFLQTLFGRTSFMEHFHFYTNLKFNWENFIFHLCPNVALFLKNVFIFKDRTLKKIILKGRGFRGGSDEKMRRMWFGLDIDVIGLPPLAQQSKRSERKKKCPSLEIINEPASIYFICNS